MILRFKFPFRIKQISDTAIEIEGTEGPVFSHEFAQACMDWGVPEADFFRIQNEAVAGMAKASMKLEILPG